MQHRVAIVTTVAIVVALASVAVGGVPLLLGLAMVAVLMLATLPGRPRSYLLRRIGRIAISIFVTMGLLWLLVHNYPDASRLDDTGVVPAMRRYVEWLGGLVSGELGESSYSESVGEGVSRSLPISLQLVGYSQVLALLIAIPGALLGAQFRGRVADLAYRGVGLILLSSPIYLTGPLLMQLFGVGELRLFGRNVGFQVLPVARYVPWGSGIADHLRSMALPTLTLALSTAAIYLVLLRSEMISQLAADHVRLARSKGLPPSVIVRRHALRPAAPTTVAAVAAQAGFVLGNMLIVERIFTLPGFGDYVLVAIGRRDVLAVAGTVFVAALILAVINLFAEALLLVVDPRLDH